MMPSLNLFRQASAEADVRSEMSNIGIALLVVGLIVAAGLWQVTGPRWFVAVPVLVGVYFAYALKVAAQWQKAAVLRLGRYRGLRGRDSSTSSR